MLRIFISYRRSISQAITDRIYERLIKAFGEKNVFKDVDAIALGQDFRHEVRKAAISCQVMLVIIAPKWADIVDPHGNKLLDNPKDWVRIEVEIGLQNKSVEVIPVLVENATIPDRNNLPDELKDLSFRQAVRIGNDPYFNADIEKLIKSLKPYEHQRSKLFGRFGFGSIVVIFTAILLIFYAVRDTKVLIEFFSNVLRGSAVQQAQEQNSTTETEASTETPKPSSTLAPTRTATPITTQASIITAKPQEGWKISVFEKPVTDGGFLFYLPANSEVTVLGRAEQGGWLRVQLDNGLGWINARYVDLYQNGAPIDRSQVPIYSE